MNDIPELEEHLKMLKAPALDPSFDLRVLDELDQRGYFEPRKPSVLQLIINSIPKLALVACLLLFFWMGNLALTKPSEDLRALQPQEAKTWSNLPDAVPPESLPGITPAGRDRRLVKK